MRSSAERSRRDEIGTKKSRAVVNLGDAPERDEERE